jgi:hypothetical protein
MRTIKSLVHYVASSLNTTASVDLLTPFMPVFMPKEIVRMIEDAMGSASNRT